MYIIVFNLMLPNELLLTLTTGNVQIFNTFQDARLTAIEWQGNDPYLLNYDIFKLSKE